MENLKKFYIDGKWIEPQSSATFPVTNPATEEEIGVIAMGGKKDVDIAVCAAKNAFILFSQTSKEERLILLKKIRDITSRRFDELAEAITIEMGAPSTMAKEAQADAAIGHLDGFINALENLKESSVREPMEKRGIDSNYWIWEPPNYTKNYVVSADVSRGDGTDYSAFHIIDVESLEQVAEYKGKISTQDFGNMLVNVASEYNNALLVVENNNIGWAAIQQVIDREYPNLFYTSKDLQ